jgi:hypothetical protein
MSPIIYIMSKNMYTHGICNSNHWVFVIITGPFKKHCDAL